MKKILAILISGAMLPILAVSASAHCGHHSGRNARQYYCQMDYIDENGDGICDNCSLRCKFTDADGDGICDNCKFTDTNGDGICDYCKFTDVNSDGICDNCKFTDGDGDGICDNLNCEGAGTYCGTGRDKGCRHNHCG